MHVLILYLSFDAEDTAQTRPLIDALTERCKGIDFTLVHIDNANEGGAWVKKNEGEYYTGGDNRYHEFSGWDAGWYGTEQLEIDFDGVIITNDALNHSLPQHQLTFIDADLLKAANLNRTVIGWMDTYANVAPYPLPPRSMQIFKYRTHSWLATAFVYIPRQFFNAAFPLTAFKDYDNVFYENFEDGIFRPDCGLSEAMQKFLIVHQTQVWYKRYELNADTFQQFKFKTRSIINEHLLTCRLRDGGACFISLRAVQDITLPDSLRFRYHLWRTWLRNQKQIWSSAWKFYTMRGAKTER